MNSDWIPVSEQKPPLNTEVLGQDAYYGHVAVCIWESTSFYPNGRLDDKGEPFLVFTDSQKDDCDIRWWQPLPS